MRTQDIEGVVFSTIDLEKYTMRFQYPNPGKVVGLIHDQVSLGKEMPVITIGYLSDMVILRATKPVLPVATIIKNLKKFKGIKVHSNFTNLSSFDIILSN